MMNPDTGTMHPIDPIDVAFQKALHEQQGAVQKVLERMARDGSLRDAETMEPLPANAVLFSEGEEMELRGCWFRVAAVRRTRLTLIPIPRPR